MRTVMRSLQNVTWRLFARADAAMNRLYGWRFNPLYHSGALVVALFLVLLATGVVLLFFYRLGAPYESVAALTAQPWLGRWLRGLHRYASDAAVVAVVLHALRMFAQGRSWGPRALAWITGLVLVFVTLICGWTGLVMVWDVPAQVLAREGARLFDVLPIFAEPISRAFVGERPIPGAFFFLNLFAHIALPIGIGLLVWLHVSRVARAGLLPPRVLMWAVIGLLFGLALAWRAPLGPPADLFQAPGRAPYDAFYTLWLPLSRALPAGVVWLLTIAGGAVLLAIPWWARPAKRAEPPKSVVDESICTGCEQCYIDCPYEAIAMIARPGGTEGGRSALVGHVTPELCVSCGICAGSCAPMGVGPAGRTGRDQLAAIRAFIAARPLGARDVVVVACDRGAGGIVHDPAPGVRVWPISCAGNLHTSVVELLIRAGAGGVLVAACPPRDCWNREGAKWTEQRLFHDREAELQERVDRRRVRLIFAAAGDRAIVAAALREFQTEITVLAGVGAAEPDADVVRECDTAPTPS
ncbi:MAG TPA: hydrogenase iron-sulfur subunit [Gemmatimonadales bacterium]|jgi:coenzyme F420-reducing hydrogenase delta subunit/Pyruvate/2-oxoacid:ferredoxin oxidoreductase delta subunit|nr:hydrogenase iron-sulfur subunit [Gemmatimonadales bacterium]